MSSTEPLLAAVGDNCIDEIGPVPAGSGAPRPVTRLAGGNAVNVAVQASLAGLRAAYFGAVGRDDNGAIIEDALVQRGVDVAHLVRRSAPTSVTEIHVMHDGERILAREDFGACAGYVPDKRAFEALLAASHVHIGWLDDGGALRRALVKAGRSVSQDLTVNTSAEHLGADGLDPAFCSLAGGADEAEGLAKKLLAEGARSVVVTRGANGASVFSGSEAIHLPAKKVDPIDTTGAGDSFIAGFLAARLRGADARSACEIGIATATRTCSHQGGFPQEP